MDRRYKRDVPPDGWVDPSDSDPRLGENAMGMAKINVSKELLVSVLHLPPDTMILDAQCLSPLFGASITLTVQHDDLKPTDATIAEIPLATPQFRRQDDVAFLGWGQDDPPQAQIVEKQP